MESGQPASDATWSAGHTIVYLAGEDSRVDRANIALLRRVVAKSTTLVCAEIWYHRPLRLNNWAEAQENLRYRKLRSAGEFVLAERLLAAGTEKVIFISHSALLHATDIWHLLGLAGQQAYTVARPQQTLRGPGENAWRFALRTARNELELSLALPPTPGNAALAINKRMLALGTGRTRGFRVQKEYADLLAGVTPLVAKQLNARSRLVAANRPQWLRALAATLSAFQYWRSECRFPAWVTPRLPLFLVAQLAMYLAVLTVPVSLSGCLMLAGFAVAISPGFALRGLTTLLPRLFHRPAGIVAAARLMLCRLMLFLLG